MSSQQNNSSGQRVMDFISSLGVKDFEIIDNPLYFQLRIGNQIGAINFRDLLIADSPSKRHVHTKECLEAQHITCPRCGNKVLIEFHPLYEESYYDGFCDCGWNTDDDSAWVNNYDFPLPCDCPYETVPPIGSETILKDLIRALTRKNNSSHTSIMEEDE